MIRIRGGMELRMAEMTRFEKAVTTMTERPMTIAGLSLVVTASAEQIPKICTVTGFSKFRGFASSLNFFEEKMLMVIVFYL